MAINRVMDVQGFQEAITFGAEWDAIAHDSPGMLWIGEEGAGARHQGRHRVVRAGRMSAAGDDILRVARDGGVATITLHRPDRLNAWTSPLESAMPPRCASSRATRTCARSS